MPSLPGWLTNSIINIRALHIHITQLAPGRPSSLLDSAESPVVSTASVDEFGSPDSIPGAADLATSSAAGVELPTAAITEEPAVDSIAPGPTASTAEADSLPWWRRSVAAECPILVAAFGSRLQDLPGHTVRDRQSLAYQRGRQAAAIRRGEQGYFTGPRVPLKNRCYVVLRGPATEDPFFTWNLSAHQAAVVSPRGGGISRISISHGFPSQAEALAFCLGAGLRGLPETR